MDANFHERGCDASGPSEPIVVVRGGDPLLAGLASRGFRFDVGWAIVDEVPPEAILLAEGPHGAELRVEGDPPGRGVRCDWAWLKTALRSGSLRRNPVAKAVGPCRTVVDATAGFGDDAMLLSALGCRVLAVERHPVIAAILDDGLLRARHDPVLAPLAARIDLRHADALDLLATARRGGELGLHADRRPEAILLDPMFPPKRRRSALPRKAIQVLRRVVGDDTDADALLEAALAVATQRVIVKRLDDGPPLREPVDFTVRSRTVRCDVYRPHGRTA